MSAIKWKNDEFQVTRCLLDRATFDRWLANDGRAMLKSELERTRLRWIFGRARARRRLWRPARDLFSPRSGYSVTVKRRLDRLPELVRRMGLVIKRSGHRDLFSIDRGQALVVVPRAAVRNDFALLLSRELGKSPVLGRFESLAALVLGRTANEAESVFFRHLAKGRLHVDAGGRGMILEVDAKYAWQLDGIDGHYYYGYADAKTNLKQNGNLRRFRQDMKELLYAQSVYLHRLRRPDIREIGDAFRSGQSGERRRALMRETSKPVVLVRNSV